MICSRPTEKVLLDGMCEIFEFCIKELELRDTRIHELETAMKERNYKRRQR